MGQSLTGKKFFGAGRAWAINNVSIPTPTRFLIPQDMTVSFKRQIKNLFGENQFSEDNGVGESTVTGKITSGASNARIFADLLFGSAGTSGQTLEVDETGTIATHAYTVTNASDTPLTDLGVVNKTNGQRYVRVASSSETAGVSYSFNASTGVYSFNASETGTVFVFSYKYTVAGAGETVALANQPMGRVGGFTGVLVFPWTRPDLTAEQDVLTLNNCVASDYEVSTKGGDYGKPPFSFEAAVDSSETIGTFTFAEAA